MDFGSHFSPLRSTSNSTRQQCSSKQRKSSTMHNSEISVSKNVKTSSMPLMMMQTWLMRCGLTRTTLPFLGLHLEKMVFFSAMQGGRFVYRICSWILSQNKNGRIITHKRIE
ncbi:hypothetical protein CVT25_004393 [Psilocybe cyanescens]|uniref:Uncharacterized protein n=1 Tax=Psilocybe cyanescens TaxID=93625 RepID=A0A409X2Y0_PSICY|nr:hypothetical protein CVT25_004393 [Psilocybe cyanescens]